MKLRFPERTVMGSWLYFFHAKGVLRSCDHLRSPAGFCAPCGDTLERSAVDAKLRRGEL